MNNLRKQIILEKLGTRRPHPPAPSPQDTAAVHAAFLKEKGYSEVPKGKELEYIVPLQEGGAAHVGNLRLVSAKKAEVGRYLHKKARKAAP